MKKIFTMLMVASMFGLVACGPSAEEKAAAEAEAEAMVNEMFEGLEDAMEEEVATESEEIMEEGAEMMEEGGEMMEDATEGEGHEHAEGEEHEH